MLVSPGFLAFDGSLKFNGFLHNFDSLSLRQTLILLLEFCQLGFKLAYIHCLPGKLLVSLADQPHEDFYLRPVQHRFQHLFQLFHSPFLLQIL